MSTVTAALYNKVSNAIRLRDIGAGASTFADQTWVYDSGTITSAADNGDSTVTVGDSTKTWMFAGGTLKRWTQATPGSNGIPAWDWGSYDMVIEAPSPDYTPDPRKVLTYPITLQADATHVTVAVGLADRITERRLTAVGDLVGRRYWILRRGGSDWTRGYFDQPNDPATAFGRVQGVAVDTGAVTTTLTSSRNIDDVVVGNEVLYLDSGDVMRRKAVTALNYAARTLTWAGTSNPPVVSTPPTPLREFYAVAAGGVWIWGAQGGTANTAYSGLRTDSYVGHGTDDELASAAMPTLSFDVMYGTDAGSCPAFATSTPIFNRPLDGRDIDLWYPQDNACGTRDTYVNARMHKNVRDWWSDLMGICTGYVPNQDYDGALAIPNFSIATWLYVSNVNPVSGTCGTHSGGSMPCALSVPHTPITLWWSILDDSGAPLLNGYHEAYDGATITGTFSAAHDGKAVVGSVGPTRPVPKRFGLMFDVVYFLPDIDAGSAQTPSNTFPGTWTIRPKSTHYRMSDADHFVRDSSLARHLITNGDYARWVGDQRDDPGLPVLISDPDDPLAPFHNNAYVGTRARATQNSIDGSRSGTATGGSTVRIVDTSKNWLAVDFYPPSNGLTITFTPDDTAGDGVSCTATGITIGALWDAARFPGFAAPFAGFTVEFLVSGSSFSDPAAVIDKRLITGATGGFIEWDETATVSGDPDTGRIREPAVLNRWKDRTVTVRFEDGTEETVAILGNHDDTLFVATLSQPVTAGCSYTIHEPEMSGVYHRVSGEWVTTAGAGADPRYTATAAVFRPKARNNIEDRFTEYGLYRPNDQPFTDACFAEVVAAVNTLDMIKISGGWIDTASNKRDAGWHNENTYTLWQDGVTNGGAGRTPPDADTSYYPYNGPANGTGAPFAVWDAWVVGQYLPPTPSWQVTSGFLGDVRRQFNHFQVTLPDNVYSKSVEFFNLAAKGGTVAPSNTYNVSSEDFDANGDAVAEGVWTRWDTDSGTTGTVTSSQLGSLTIPNAATAPSISALPAATVPQSGTSAHVKGYRVVDAVAVISYGFPALTL